jgi:hypothetical protein
MALIGEGFTAGEFLLIRNGGEVTKVAMVAELYLKGATRSQASSGRDCAVEGTSLDQW